MKNKQHVSVTYTQPIKLKSKVELTFRIKLIA